MTESRQALSRQFASRAEREAHARKLRDEGKLLREIAAEMGVAISTVNAWLCDPGGKRMKARKESYRGRCVDCDVPTDGSNGRDGAPERCLPCTHEHDKRLTRAWILESMREWCEMFGVPPTAVDWNQHHARNLAERSPGYSARVIARYESTGRPWPSAESVQRLFGSWSEGLRAAGFQPISNQDRWLGYRGRAAREEDRRAA